jgi:molecular chaperone DnaJ
VRVAGAGRVLVRERLKVQVPAGARAGAKMRLPGKGNDGLGGRAAGDLYLLLEPVQIAGYLRDGADLRATLEVPAASSAETGGPLNVPTPWGPMRLDVPAATRTGMKFRLRGQGLPVWQRATRGDLYLQVQVA